MKYTDIQKAIRVMKTEEVNNRDFIASKGQLLMRIKDPNAVEELQAFQTVPRLVIDENTVMPLNKWAHEQLAGKLEIPIKYYERMRHAAPELLSNNVNTWLQKKVEGKNGQKLLIRTTGSEVRAVLSDKYKPIPNHSVVLTVLGALNQIQGVGFDVKECAVSDTAMYLKITSNQAVYMNPAIEGGDAWFPGIMVRNSEVGGSKFQVDVYTWRQWCKNGAILTNGLSRVHLGRKIGGEGEVFFSDRTDELDIKTVLSAMSDVVKQVFVPEKMNELLERVKAGQKVEVEDKVQAVEGLCEHFKIPDNEQEEILARFTEKSQYSLGNAITELGRDTENEDRQIKLEELGGEVLLLDEKTFKKVTAWKEE